MLKKLSLVLAVFLSACGGGDPTTQVPDAAKANPTLCAYGCGNTSLDQVYTERIFDFDLGLGGLGDSLALGDFGLVDNGGAPGAGTSAIFPESTSGVYQGAVNFSGATNLPVSTTMVFVDVPNGIVQQNIYVNNTLSSTLFNSISSYASSNGKIYIPVYRFKNNTCGFDC